MHPIIAIKISQFISPDDLYPKILKWIKDMRNISTEIRTMVPMELVCDDGDNVVLSEDGIDLDMVVSSGMHHDNIALGKYLGRERCEFNEEDEKYIDTFWDPTFNKSWMYVTKEMVRDMMGYKESKYMVRDFHRVLIKDYEEGLEYEEVKENHPLVLSYQESFGRKTFLPNNDKFGRKVFPPHHNAKHYIITGETFKSILQSARTKQGKITRKYFIKVESLLK